MRDALPRICGCGAPATFRVTRTHDGGGRTFTCDAHLANASRTVAAGLPSWASHSTTTLTVVPL